MLDAEYIYEGQIASFQLTDKINVWGSPKLMLPAQLEGSRQTEDGMDPKYTLLTLALSQLVTLNTCAANSGCSLDTHSFSIQHMGSYPSFTWIWSAKKPV